MTNLCHARVNNRTGVSSGLFARQSEWRDCRVARGTLQRELHWDSCAVAETPPPRKTYPDDSWGRECGTRKDSVMGTRAQYEHDAQDRRSTRGEHS